MPFIEHLRLLWNIWAYHIHILGYITWVIITMGVCFTNLCDVKVYELESYHLGNTFSVSIRFELDIKREVVVCTIDVIGIYDDILSFFG